MQRVTDLQTLEVKLLDVPPYIQAHLSTLAIRLGNHYRHKLGMEPSFAMKSAWNYVRRNTRLEV
jgi:hypothetical protein